MAKLSNDSFIERCNLVHDYKYDYSETIYISMSMKIVVTCYDHGEFTQRADVHSRGQGCPKCAGNSKRSTDDFIKEAINIHNDMYDYMKTNYESAHKKVVITCSKHGDFHQEPNNHLNGQGCPKCSKNYKSNTEEFITKANLVHDDVYDYNLVEYTKSRNKVDIICRLHGMFTQTPNNHLNGQGCPVCKESKGERIIRKFLSNNNIKFIREKKFKDCVYKSRLPFDFYLPSHNMCIEFDGEQHFKKFRFEINDEKLKIRKKRDNIKNQYCIDNNIKLYRIRYDEDIDNELEDILKCII